MVPCQKTPVKTKIKRHRPHTHFKLLLPQQIDFSSLRFYTFAQNICHMKDKKRFLIIFAVFWMIGMLGGYFLGVGSSFLPSENIDYNYYYTEKAEGSDVEPIKRSCKENKECTEHNQNRFGQILKDSGVLNVPQKIANRFLK